MYGQNGQNIDYAAASQLMEGLVAKGDPVALGVQGQIEYRKQVKVTPQVKLYFNQALQAGLNAAADQGEPTAAWLMGRAFEFGAVPSGVDYKVAAMWYGKAAAKDHSIGQLNLGWLYSNGRE
eukprot:c12901_g1_i2.p1 GENE.c12901_g1_i2~~c12901_g1_i2.p1  ORF type:complete len:122 (+),score=28.78 c12901_g1_i2:213-578(+)